MVVKQFTHDLKLHLFSFRKLVERPLCGTRPVGSPLGTAYRQL